MDETKTVAVIVAHPDDETLWAGGTIMDHPYWQCYIASVCRKSDPDRSSRFYQALAILGAEGIMGDLDDGPEQRPLDEKLMADTILALLPSRPFDLLISHNPSGEYTRHLRHEEVSQAVIHLWLNARISAQELWTFAYEDGNKLYLPKPVSSAPVFYPLSEQTWLKKYNIITGTYGFDQNSWEAETTPRAESFWQFTDPAKADKWLMQSGIIG